MYHRNAILKTTNETFIFEKIGRNGVSQIQTSHYDVQIITESIKWYFYYRVKLLLLIDISCFWNEKSSTNVTNNNVPCFGHWCFSHDVLMKKHKKFCWNHEMHYITQYKWLVHNMYYTVWEEQQWWLILSTMIKYTCTKAIFWKSFCIFLTTLIARFMGPTWGPSGADRTQGPRLNIKTVFPRYEDSHVKDKTVGETVLSLTWESLYW